MAKNVKRNRKREPSVKQIDKQGWKDLARNAGLILLTCVLAIGIPFGVYLFYHYLVETDYFVPKRITVHGNVRVSDQAILDASGLLIDGTNLNDINVHTINASIETLPWIKSARAVIELPDTVNIEITEHEPIGIVNDGELNIVDNEGKYIKTWEHDDPIMSPIVSIENPLSESAYVVIQAFQIAETVTRRGYLRKIEEVHYDDAIGYTLYTDSTEIRLGYDRFDERIDRLILVDGILDKRKVLASYILIDGDTSLDRIVVKPQPKIVKPQPSKPAENTNGDAQKDSVNAL